MAGKGKAFAKEAKRIIRGVLRFKDAAPFMHMKPDDKAREGYVKENPEPIFLGDVWDKLKKDKYESFNAVDADVQRVWSQEDRYRNACDKFDADASKRYRQYQAVKNYYQIMAAPMLKKKLAEPTPPQSFRTTSAISSAPGRGRKGRVTTSTTSTTTTERREVLDLTNTPGSAPPGSKKTRKTRTESVIRIEDDEPVMPLAKPKPKGKGTKPKAASSKTSLSAAAVAEEVKQALGGAEEEEEDNEGETISEDVKPIDSKNTGTGAERSGLRIHRMAPQEDPGGEVEEDGEEEAKGRDRERERERERYLRPLPSTTRKERKGGGGSSLMREQAMSTGTRTAQRKAKYLAAIRQEAESGRRQSFPKAYKSPIRSTKRSLRFMSGRDSDEEDGEDRLYEPPAKRRHVFTVRYLEKGADGIMREKHTSNYAHSIGEVLNDPKNRAPGIKIISVSRAT